MDRVGRLWPLVLRFGLAGAANTLIGAVLIAALDLGLGVAPPIANAAGYGLGVAISFGLNRMFVFRSARSSRAAGPRFLLAAFAAFVLNQTVLLLAEAVLGPVPPARMAAQLCAMTTYSGVLFVLCRLWVFPDAVTALGSKAAGPC